MFYERRKAYLSSIRSSIVLLDCATHRPVSLLPFHNEREARKYAKRQHIEIVSVDERPLLLGGEVRLRNDPS